MHLKRIHGAVCKITSTTDISTSDEASAAFVLPEATNNFTSMLRDTDKEFFNDKTIDLEQAIVAVDSDNNTVDIQQMCDNETMEDILMRDLAIMVSSLLSNLTIPRKSVQFFIKNISVFLTSSLTLALKKWHDCDLSEDGTPDINNFLSIIKNSIANFSTEYTRHKYYQEIGTFIYPQEYSIALENVEFFRGLRKQVVEINKTQNANEKIYPLLLYYDEFETGNPLSSHAGIHKLGAVYTAIACLPPHLASQIKYIFLFALFHYSDRDNLGLHSILGFVESFNANYPCRICKAKKVLIQQMSSEDISLLRNEENYAADIAIENPSETGIRHRAIWYKLDNFYLFKQVAVDVMHDILEGIVRYVMTFVINSLLKKKLFSIQELNERAKAFDYGPDTNNKPPLLSLQNTFKIKWKMSSSEALNYIRYFSCLISHKIPDNDRIMEKLGPLRNLWSMRYEAKHRVFKTAAKNSANRINICKTLAIRHQLQLNHLFLENKLASNFQHSCKLKNINSQDLTALSIQFDLPLSMKLYTASFVKINGVTYRLDDVLALHFDEYGDPIFIKISKIFVCLIEKKVFFKGYLYETVTFDSHVYAYLVEETDRQHFVSYDALIFVYPNTISILPPFDYFYITVRNCFD
ncbi:hypothetical protein ALC62_07169 [Cyphomyrmex costatus]|uniref:Uncharacterized protein n=1 Tax=Cyphomyrmex costatus TaxID=456900 RepID=A0A151IHY5_9HYME|nr:hypothetical protein ALC62_07169 [Cyphomyrmex costatus]